MSTGTETERDAFACVVVGGGIHGTHVTQRLLEETAVERSDLLVVDPHDRLLASFREKAKRCGMEALRSTYVQHVGTEPFDLESFAEGTGRDDELVETAAYPDRPTLDLFLDHADAVIDRKRLDDLHRRATVEEIHPRPNATDGVRLETTAGRVDARRCVLAIGHGDRYRRPAWATAASDAAADRIVHVWDGFDPDAPADRTVVIGGGITAVQLACALADRHAVSVVTRHPLRCARAAADPPWINWSHVERELHRHPPGSRARLDVVDRARHTATVPPYLHDELAERRDAGSLSVVRGTVASARRLEDGVALRLRDGTVMTADRAVLATGFEPPFDHPFVDRLSAELGLVRGARGTPVLDDDTLAWRRTDGTVAPVHVTGALALATVGPYAPNVPGAKRAGDRIVAAINRALDGSAIDRPTSVAGDPRTGDAESTGSDEGSAGVEALE